MDLYNNAFWWEAHEIWEGLWHAAACRGVQSDYLKGLIQCAAALLKIEQGRLRGARELLTRALGHLDRVQRSAAPRGRSFMGLEIGEFTNALRVHFGPLLDGNEAPDRARGFPRITLWP